MSNKDISNIATLERYFQFITGYKAIYNLSDICNELFYLRTRVF